MRAVLAVLHEDNHLLVVDKPSGLLTQAAQAGDDTLVERARAYLKQRWRKPGNAFVGLVQRLDRSTSGVVVLAKTSKAASRLAEQLRTRAGFAKTYLAIVQGALATPRRLVHTLAEVGDGVVVTRDDDPRGKRAVLEVTPRAVGAGATLVEVALETGRKHQIRAQLAAVGHALLGDGRYGGPRTTARVMLHAWRVTITHPVRAESLTFEAPIPADFQEVLARLGLAV